MSKAYSITINAREKLKKKEQGKAIEKARPSILNGGSLTKECRMSKQTQRRLARHISGVRTKGFSFPLFICSLFSFLFNML